MIQHTLIKPRKRKKEREREGDRRSFPIYASHHTASYSANSLHKFFLIDIAMTKSRLLIENMINLHFLHFLYSSHLWSHTCHTCWSIYTCHTALYSLNVCSILYHKCHYGVPYYHIYFCYKQISFQQIFSPKISSLPKQANWIRGFIFWKKKWFILDRNWNRASCAMLLVDR